MKRVYISLQTQHPYVAYAYSESKCVSCTELKVWKGDCDYAEKCVIQGTEVVKVDWEVWPLLPVVWLFDGDMIPTGEFIPENIAGVANYYGRKIEVLDASLRDAINLYFFAQTNDVMYHGTAGDNINSILVEGFKPTQGMLGHGVYFGSFWKACRFACRDQHYNFRDVGTVIRCVLPKQSYKLPSPCGCISCIENFHETSPRRLVCDHISSWKSLGLCGAYAPAAVESCGTKRDGSSIYTLKNDEWCVDDKHCGEILDIKSVDMSTVDGPHYNPLQRNISVY